MGCDKQINKIIVLISVVKIENKNTFSLNKYLYTSNLKKWKSGSPSFQDKPTKKKYKSEKFVDNKESSRKSVVPKFFKVKKQPKAKKNVVKKLFHNKNNKPFLYFRTVWFVKL